MGVLGRFVSTFRATTDQLQQLREKTQAIQDLQLEKQQRQDSINRQIAGQTTDAIEKETNDPLWFTNVADKDPNALPLYQAKYNIARAQLGLPPAQIVDVRPTRWAQDIAAFGEEAVKMKDQSPESQAALQEAFKNKLRANYGDNFIATMANTLNAKMKVDYAQKADAEEAKIKADAAKNANYIQPQDTQGATPKISSDTEQNSVNWQQSQLGRLPTQAYYDDQIAKIHRDAPPMTNEVFLSTLLKGVSPDPEGMSQEDYWKGIAAFGNKDSNLTSGQFRAFVSASVKSKHTTLEPGQTIDDIVNEWKANKALRQDYQIAQTAGANARTNLANVNAKYIDMKTDLGKQQFDLELKKFGLSQKEFALKSDIERKTLMDKINNTRIAEGHLALGWANNAVAQGHLIVAEHRESRESNPAKSQKPGAVPTQIKSNLIAIGANPTLLAQHPEIYTSLYSTKLNNHGIRIVKDTVSGLVFVKASPQTRAAIAAVNANPNVQLDIHGDPIAAPTQTSGGLPAPNFQSMPKSQSDSIANQFLKGIQGNKSGAQRSSKKKTAVKMSNGAIFTGVK